MYCSGKRDPDLREQQTPPGPPPTPAFKRRQLRTLCSTLVVAFNAALGSPHTIWVPFYGTLSTLSRRIPSCHPDIATTLAINWGRLPSHQGLSHSCTLYRSTSQASLFERDIKKQSCSVGNSHGKPLCERNPAWCTLRVSWESAA